jgi:uncharacterized protein (DUF2147 family)
MGVIMNAPVTPAPLAGMERRMMRARHLTVAVAIALLSLVNTAPAPADEPTAAGLWQSTDQDTGQPTGWFLIRDHDDVYEGTIVKMFLKPGEDPNVVCNQCTGDRHDKPWLGLDIIRGMKRDGSSYTGGTILDPRNGQVYSAMMTLSPDGQTLTVRGYLGISLLGKNQYWTRLPDSAFKEIDPRFNPAHAATAPPRKLPAVPTLEDSARQ